MASHQTHDQVQTSQPGILDSAESCLGLLCQLLLLLFFPDPLSCSYIELHYSPGHVIHVHASVATLHILFPLSGVPTATSLLKELLFILQEPTQKSAASSKPYLTPQGWLLCAPRHRVPSLAHHPVG